MFYVLSVQCVSNKYPKPLHYILLIDYYFLTPTLSGCWRLHVQNSATVCFINEAVVISFCPQNNDVTFLFMQLNPKSIGTLGDSKAASLFQHEIVK